MRINIVVDNSQSWFVANAKHVVATLGAHGHTCCFLTSAQRIPKKSDITFFLSCEQFIPEKIRVKSAHNIIVHASNLPKGRGWSPATWQILEGKKNIPVTLFEATNTFDAGDYYLKDSIALNGTELIDEWREKLSECIEGLIFKFIKKPRLKPQKQRGTPTFYKRRGPEDSKLDIHKSLKEQFNLLRVVDNDRYPAFFRYKNQKYILNILKK